MAGKYVLFVHGIGPQTSGYSDKLWDVLWDSMPKPDIEKRELFYYDSFQTAQAKLQVPTYAALIGQGVNALVAKVWPGVSLAPSVADFVTNTLAHVAYFLAFPQVQNEVLLKFEQSLLDIIADAEAQDVYFPQTEITVVSHSLGTVVSYLAMHRIAPDDTLGISNHVGLKNLYTLATPLELIRRVSSWFPGFLHINHITDGISRPIQTVDDSRDTNIREWFSFRHNWDPVGSLAPLTGQPPLDSPETEPFVFGDVQLTHTHDFDKYMEQAREHIRNHL
jgi:hypothetical protein